MYKISNYSQWQVYEMNNTTEALNNSINTTANGTGYWRPFEKGELPDVQTFLLNAETYFNDMLISWGLEPTHIYFQMLLGAIGLIAIYYIFVRGTSGASKLFIPLLYVAITIVILLILGVI